MDNQDKRDFSNFKKGIKVKMTFGCYDDYEGTIINNSKYKLVISTTILNKKVHIETKDFLKKYIRSIEII
jgi:transcription antitermination factor NusG